MAWDGDQGQVFHWDTCFPPHSAYLQTLIHTARACPLSYSLDRVPVDFFFWKNDPGRPQEDLGKGSSGPSTKTTSGSDLRYAKRAFISAVPMLKKKFENTFLFFKAIMHFLLPVWFSHTPYHHSLYSTLFSCYYPFNTIASPINVAAYRTFSAIPADLFLGVEYFNLPAPVLKFCNIHWQFFVMASVHAIVATLVYSPFDSTICVYNRTVHVLAFLTVFYIVRTYSQNHEIFLHYKEIIFGNVFVLILY